MITDLNWLSITYDVLFKLWEGFLSFVPALILALLIFFIGWLIAVGIGQLIVKILENLKFNRYFEKNGWKEAFEKANLELNAAEFVGAIFKWIIVIVFLLIAVEILGFEQFASFLASVIRWLPNLLVAVAIFVVAVILAEFVGKLTVISLEKAKIAYSQVAGKIVKGAIWVFAILSILFQLGVVRPLIETFFTGLMAGLALAFGIAFGLGGKDAAADFINDIRQRLKK
jgi:small-conductance mechanosensitive channel